MKAVKLFSITGLFFIACILGACNHSTKDSDTDGTVSSEGMSRPYVKNNKNDSTAHNDTIVTSPNDTSMDKNNPDISK